MKTMKTFVLLCVSLLLVVSPVLSETKVEIDLEKLDDFSRNKVLNALKETEKEGSSILPKNPEEIREWGRLGKDIGQAIGATAKELSIQVNDFIKTPAGVLTVGIILWKVVGNELFDIVFGIPIWFLLTLGCVLTMRKYLGRERIPLYETEEIEDKRGKVKKIRKLVDVKYVPRYEYNDSDYKVAVAIVLGLITAVIQIVFIAMIFTV